MELERPLYPLLCDTLKYLDAGVSGKVTNVVKNKNNKFIFHVSLPTCEKIDIEDMHLALLNEDIIHMSNVQPGLLLGCLHPLNKKWMRCYVISILLGEAHVALCDTGEITKTKILKNVPDRFRNIPAISFEAEVMCICPLNILQHLMENFNDYTAIFETFKNAKHVETHRKMRLTRARVSVDFIVQKWDLENHLNTDCINNELLMFQNGCAVILAKANNYDWRHIFVRSVDQFANVCKELQTYCKHALNIQRNPAVGDVVAVKCIDKFYRGKIIDVLNESCFYLYLIDSGFIIEASIDSLVDLSETLQKIPSTVCLVGLKSITLKPWTPETSLYITSLFENSVTMIVEYTNHDSFGLDSVTLTSMNKSEDVNGRMKELLKSVEDCDENEYNCLNPIHDLNLIKHLKSSSIIPVKIETQVKSDSKVMSEHTESSLIPGCTVYMTGFVNLDEIYIRKLEDHNDEFEKFLDLVNDFCSSATPINRPLLIGEIVGAQSTLDENYYRAKVLKQIDNLTYFTQFVDFGDKDNVPVSNIFEIPKQFMVPTNVMKITLKGVTNINSSMNADALKYISNLLSNYTPMIIDFSPLQPLKDVTLTTLSDNEKVNEQLIKLLNITSSTSITKKANSPTSVDLHSKDYYCEDSLPKLKLGDSVYITLFNDVHHIFVRKVEEYEAENVEDFIARVDSYCSSARPIGKLPKLNDIIGARAIDGYFYRAKVVKKVNDVSYNVQLIDFGIEENIQLSNIVSLSSDLKQVVPSIVLIKLKGFPLASLNVAAREYINHISENETLIVDFIEDSTNEVILKTDKNVIINDHLHMLLFGNDGKIEVNSSIEITKEKCKLGDPVQSIPECISVSIHPGCTVYMTAFVDMNEIYVRKLDDYNDEFHIFLDRVNDFCQSATPINGPLAVGEIVGAQLALDEHFYRGKVLKQVDEASYLIHFIDFGDKEIVLVSNLFKIPEEFMVLSTIVKITLKGVKPCPLNVETSTYISSLLASYEPMIIDFDPTFPLKDVTLTIVNSNENFAECLNKFLEEVVVTADNNKEIKYLQELQVTQEEDINDELRNGDIVCITAYIDLANIYVRKVDTNDELIKLNEKVNDYCFLGSAAKSMTPELNQIVGAKSSADRSFYRARVIEKTDENNYNVLFIDFGFEENVDVADIVYLPLQLQQVIPNISLVGLKGSTFDNLDLEDHEYFEELILHNEKMKIEFEDLNAVTLIIVNLELNIMEYLNKLHENDSTMNDTIIDNSIQHTSGMKYISHDINIPEIPPLSNGSIVTIHAFVDLKSIYVSVCFDKSRLNKFVKDFAELCLISKCFITNPVIGEVYGIKSSTDGWFYRGSIVKKLYENQYSVVFFDLGNKDIVSANSFVEIAEQLKRVPQSIYCVSLKGVHSENLNDQAISYVNMLCENMPLVIEFDEKSPNALFEVTLTAVKTQQNVNYHLATLLTEKDRDSPETVQKLSKGDIVYISSFMNLRTVYIKWINNGTDKFKSFIENLSSCCALNNPIERQPNVGEVIAAKEKSSAKFYRAEVISKVDDEHFKVCFIDFGSREIVNKNDIVELSESQVNNCPPTFLVGLKGFDSEPVKPKVLQYIKKISDAETFIIDYINEQNKVVLISVNTQRNINKEIKKLINFTEQHIIKNEVNVNDVYNEDANSVIKYSSLNLGIPIQVWVAEKFSSSRYSVHTHDSRAEFIRLEKQMFDDSKGFVPIKHVKVNMPCIVYFSPSWYRGTILEIIDQFTAKIGLLDVGNYSVVRNIKEIFCMPSKYNGKTLLINIEIQPEPLEKLAFTSFKIVPKQCLDNGTIIVEIVDSSVDQSYDDLDNLGLPSFSSTPIPGDSDRSFCLNSLNEENSPTILCDQQNCSSSLNLSNKQLSMLTIKDVQYAKWLLGSSKTLTVLCTYQDCLVMRDHMIDDSLTDLETKIQSYCLTIEEPYCPAENELCLAKYCDELWYRAICIKTASMPNEHSLMVYFLDWGIEYSVIVGDIRKMSKDFVYLPATAHKCYVEGLNASEWSADTMTAVAEYMLTQVNCVIVEKLSSDTYTILCDTIKNLIDTKLQ